MIKPPSGDLETALKVLEPGEEWAVMPQPVEGNPCLWTPGVKYGVRPGSYTHMTEFFGPMLAVMRFETLGEAVELVNQTGYGLTSGLDSLDEREWDYWKQHVRAGNLYINRVTTGAIVLRQPFGGMGKSGFGPGMKAGGPNYVAQFMDFEDIDAPQGVVVARTAAAGSPQAGVTPSAPTLAALCGLLQAKSQAGDARIVSAVLGYEASQREEFSREHDHFRLVGQDNVRRYLPVGSVRVRVDANDTAFDVFARACAAHVTGCRVVVSTPPGLDSADVRRLETLTESWAGAIEFVEETDAELAQAIREGQVDRVRYAAPGRASLEVLQAGNAANGCVVSVPVSGEGRLELLWYVREQSISTDYHRYGNLGMRGDEPRAEVP
jgi:RHH-type proline utilization regulon transcriptional repressor/proline dehydrogenase/delta 1-pyrroline-5-carboxylate dehydrogenase